MNNRIEQMIHRNTVACFFNILTTVSEQSFFQHYYVVIFWVDTTTFFLIMRRFGSMPLKDVINRARQV